jgi:hypothetical protein
MRVASFGQTILRGVRVKEPVTLGTAVLRIAQLDLARLPRNQVAHIVEQAGAGPIAKTRFAALGAGKLFEIATAAYDLRLRELTQIRNPCSGIR